VIAQKLKIPEGEILKLDANENPYGCSPRVREALKEYPYFNIYPDAAQTELRRYLADYTGIGVENLVAGNGSDELIDLLLRLFMAPGDEIITVVPTFDMYRFCAQVCCGRAIEVKRNADFSVNISAIKAAITDRTRAIFLANPNNPTGNLVSKADILELVTTGVPLIIDEAYYEFSGETVAHLVPAYDNLMVLRTFSKWAGLAGLRVGYGIFPARIADILLKIKPPYNVNLAAQVAVRESIKDKSYLLNTVKNMIEERSRLYQKLQGVHFLKPVPSYANFILCEVIKGNAGEIQNALEQKGILVRYYNTPLLKNYIRISVGKPEHTERVIRALHELGERIDD
jgi:histidinol-phosphate aminotransferase